MANFVLYTRPHGTEIKLKLTASRIVELESRLESSIQDKLPELEKLSTASEFLAAAIPEEAHQDRRAIALEIYDEMIESGKTVRDYLMLIYNTLSAAGFIDGRAVERQAESQEAQERLAEAVHRKEIALMENKIQKIAEIGGNTEATQS